MLNRIRRRSLLALLGVAAAGRPAVAAMTTPKQPAGPHYPLPERRFEDDDWDLVETEGAVREAGGEVLHLSGRVLDRNGRPLADVPIEIWQADINGRYLHQDDTDRKERDAGFQGFGRTLTDAEGRYRFRTIRPVPYPGRTPHIHARLGRPDGTYLITQIYLPEHELNRKDFLYRSLGRDGQQAATMTLAQRDDGDLETEFDFVL